MFGDIPGQASRQHLGEQRLVYTGEHKQIEIFFFLNLADDFCIYTCHTCGTEAKGTVRKFGLDFTLPFFTFFNRLFRGGVQMYHLQFVICAEYMTKTKDCIDVCFHISRKKTNIIQCASYSIPWNS